MLSRPESVPLNISLTIWLISLAFRKEQHSTYLFTPPQPLPLTTPIYPLFNREIGGGANSFQKAATLCNVVSKRRRRVRALSAEYAAYPQAALNAALPPLKSRQCGRRLTQKIGEELVRHLFQKAVVNHLRHFVDHNIFVPERNNDIVRGNV